MPEGTVFKITNAPGAGPSSDILIQDITIDGWRNEAAIGIVGDRITLINPIVINPDGADSNGIRVAGGTGFRCYGGSVTAGGDAPLQFSAGAAGADIIDGAYIGTRAAAIGGGRLLLVGTQLHVPPDGSAPTEFSIRNVRFIGVSGTVSKRASLVKIQNITTTRTLNTVLLRDVSIARIDSGDNKDGIVIEHGTSRPDGLTDIVFENVRIDFPDGSGLLVRPYKENPPPPTPPPTPAPVRNLAWRGGRIARVDPGGLAIDLRNVEYATFTGLSISGGNNQPMIALGDGEPVRNVSFVDTMIAGVRPGETGVRFDDAIACNWVGGGIAGDAAAIAIQMTARAKGCRVTGANLSAIGSEPKVTIDPAAAAAGCRVDDNHGSAQQSAIGLGAIVPAALNSLTIDIVSSAAAVSPGGTLKTIDGGIEGDILILSAAASLAVKDSTGNLRMKSNVTLGTPEDILFLTRRATDWLELSRSDNA